MKNAIIHTTWSFLKTTQILFSVTGVCSIMKAVDQNPYFRVMGIIKVSAGGGDRSLRVLSIYVHAVVMSEFL